MPKNVAIGTLFGLLCVAAWSASHWHRKYVEQRSHAEWYADCARIAQEMCNEEHRDIICDINEQLIVIGETWPWLAGIEVTPP